jgi:hypothetical protein
LTVLPTSMYIKICRITKTEKIMNFYEINEEELINLDHVSKISKSYQVGGFLLCFNKDEEELREFDTEEELDFEYKRLKNLNKDLTIPRYISKEEKAAAEAKHQEEAAEVVRKMSCQ